MQYTVTSIREEKENRAFFLEYLKRCDWKAGGVLAGLIEKDEFFKGDDEVFFLMDTKHIVSFLALAHKDCIDDETLMPWIGFVYTDKNYRGRRLGGQLIRHALNTAKGRGHSRVYLATGHIGLYEKYGFEYLENKRDIYGEDSRIYFYDLLSFKGETNI